MASILLQHANAPPNYTISKNDYDIGYYLLPFLISFHGFYYYSNDHSICVEQGRKPDLFKRYDVEKMIAIQFTNGFEINVVDICGRALYPTISRINHSCIPSVTHANVRKNDAFSSTIPNTSNKNKYVF